MPLKNNSENTKKVLDYRFSFANERTFLSWIRTALALLAGAVAIDQFVTTVEYPFIRIGLAIILAIIAGVLAISAFLRWRANEKAMLEGRALPYNHLLSIIAILVLIAATCFVMLFLVGH